MRRDMRNVWRGWIAVAAVLAGLAFVAARRGVSPEWRSAFNWIVTSWIRPADRDAHWQQDQAS